MFRCVYCLWDKPLQLKWNNELIKHQTRLSLQPVHYVNTTILRDLLLGQAPGLVQPQAAMVGGERSNHCTISAPIFSILLLEQEYEATEMSVNGQIMSYFHITPSCHITHLQTQTTSWLCPVAMLWRLHRIHRTLGEDEQAFLTGIFCLPLSALIWRQNRLMSKCIWC